jgi:acetoin utilization protein AcuB
MKQELVKDWMTTNIITASPETPLPEADRLMTEQRIRRLPVVKDGRLMGIVTRNDIQSAQPSGTKWVSIWELNYLLSKLEIEKVMTREPVTISAEATIAETARIMLEKKISCLPVVNGQESIIGIITESDIFRLVAQNWDDKK